MKKLLFTGGGSAGHVIPNLALMDELKEEFELYYMGTEGIEKSLVAGIAPYHTIHCPKLIRAFTIQNLKIPAQLHRAVQEAREGLKIIRPDLVFSKGGYVSLPVVLAAAKEHIPILAHECDLSPGLANRISARKCRLVLTSFPDTAKRFPNGKYTGAPIRAELFTGSRVRARQKYGIRSDLPVVLVFGGGSGARAINEGLRRQVMELCKRYTVLHICGKGNVAENNIPRYLQREFERDMASAYAAADVVVCRAGSNTVFELMALKKPAVLIPLSQNTRGDQQENAAYFRDRGLCKVLQQDRMESLPQMLEETLNDETLKRNLLSSVFGYGNQNIIREIKNCLNL